VTNKQHLRRRKMKKEEKLAELQEMLEKGKISRRRFLQLAGAAGLTGMLAASPIGMETASAAPPAGHGHKYKIDPITEKMKQRSKKLQIKTVWDRYKTNQIRSANAPNQATCLMCQQGPCVDVQDVGVCGANKDIIIAKNLVSETARGAAAHVGHARRVATILKGVGDGSVSHYSVKETEKLKNLAAGFGCDPNAEAVADTILDHDISSLTETPKMLEYVALPERQEKWDEEEIGILLHNGASIEVVETENCLAMGMDADMENLLLRACRLGLVDAYCGMHVATNVQDILLGIPGPVTINTNLTVIDEDKINILVHGHIPLLADAVIRAAEDYNSGWHPNTPDINVLGMCCTGMEVLMRNGLNFAGDILQQELAIATGAVELIIIDIQCTQPGMVAAVAASGMHTEIVTTDPMSKIEGTTYIKFEAENADTIASDLIDMAVTAFSHRNPGKVHIPDIDPSVMMGGFSTEAILAALDPLKPGDPVGALVDQIVAGNIRGIAAVIGCITPRDTYGYRTVELIKELIKNDVLVVLTGCVATVASYHDLLKPDPLYPGVGENLANVMRAIAQANGLGAVPPCLFMGACVDNSRIEEVVNAVANKVGVRIDQLPIAGSAPEYIAEKAIPIGFWTVALGIFTHLGDAPNVGASARVVQWLCTDVEEIFGGKFYVEADPYVAAAKLIEVIEEKRTALGI
jgi:carbon-monoxide dehydrogenase catalytic subunit